jgi:hypothetical protein
MARAQDWEQDIRDGRLRESWALKGPNRLVKVKPYGTLATAVGGYVTLGCYLVGMKPAEIGRALGLPDDFLRNGATIFCLTRLPVTSEYEYELTARYPDGESYNPIVRDPRYRPGAAHIHQWQIKDSVVIPVDSRHVFNLRPRERFLCGWL